MDGRTSFGWVPIDTPEEEADLSEQRWSDYDPFRMSLQAVVAQAWLDGCDLTTPPEYLRVDCGKADYLERLQKAWPDGGLAYTREALKSLASHRLFEDAEIQSLAVDGRLAVHTQRAMLVLDWDCTGCPTPNTVPGPRPVLIRTSNHRVAGSIILDEYAVERLQMADRLNGCFIALSATYGGVNFIIEKHLTAPDPSSVSRLYGCPCSFGTDTKRTFSHIVECPEHDMFPTPDDFQESALRESKCDEEYYLDRLAHKYGDIHETAFLKHMADLSYFDVNGEALHPVTIAHEINVMLIGPSQRIDGGGEVFERLGIGRVYLKRWVEASPVFETVVLE